MKLIETDVNGDGENIRATFVVCGQDECCVLCSLDIQLVVN